MADDYRDYVLGQTAPVTSGAGVDEYSKYVRGEAGEPTAPEGGVAPVAPLQAPASPAAGSYEEYVKTAGLPPERGLGETVGRGLARGWGQTAAMVPQLKAVYKEYTGDLPGAQAEMAQAEKDQAPYGESDWSLQNIHSPGDFGYWLAEKLGEQGVNFASMAVTGGVGGLAGKMAAEAALARGLVSASGAKAIQLGGMAVPTYAYTTALETANTAEEQFKVTGSTQPSRSLTAGMAKGALELLTPMDIGRALMLPGRQLGRSTARGIARVTAEEGLTEGAQEAIDIYARKLAEPGYSYFKDGPTLLPSGWDQGMWRLAEAAAAGAAVGGIYGAGPVKYEQTKETQRAVEKGKGLGFSFEGSEAPGTRRTFAPEGEAPPSSSGISLTPSGEVGPSTFKWEIKRGEETIGDFRAKITGDTAHIVLLNNTSGQELNVGEYRNIINEFQKQNPEVTTITGNRTSGARKNIDADRQRMKLDIGTGGGPGPVTTLRSIVLNPQSQDKGLGLGLDPNPQGDALGIGPLLSGLRLDEAQKETFLDTLEANTPRYVEKLPPPVQAAIRYNGEVVTGSTHFGAAHLLNEKYRIDYSKNPLIEEGFVNKEGKWLSREEAAVEVAKTNPDMKRLLLAQKGQLTAEDLKNLPAPVSSRFMTDTEVELQNALRPQGQKPRWLRVNQGVLLPAAITAHLSDLPPSGSNRVYFPPRQDGTLLSPEERVQLLAKYGALEQAAQEGNFKALANAEGVQAREALKPLYDELLTAGLRVIPSRGAGFYYNGVIDYHGLPQENPLSTGRTFKIFLLDLETGLMQVPKAGETLKPSEVPVAFDRNKLKEGVDFRIEEDGTFRVLRFPDLSKFTPGIGVLSGILPPGKMQFGFQDKPNSVVANDVGNFEPNAALAEEITGILRDALPALDAILRKLGIERGIDLFVTNRIVNGTQNSSAVAWPGDGFITFNPENIQITAAPENLAVRVHALLMHEVGHFVTFHYFNNLPAGVQSGIYYAWDQAKLSQRMGVPGKTGFPGVTEPVNVAYWHTFPEFLAEQFRRWGLSNATATTLLDKAYKDGGKRQEAYYREWERVLGKQQVMDLTNPSHYFSGAMEFLNGTYIPARDKVQQAVKRFNLHTVSQDVLDSPILTLAANTFISATESLNPMFPKDLQAQIKRFVDPGILTEELAKKVPGSYTRPQGKNLDFIEIGLAALPSREDLLSQASRITMVEELLHSYEERGMLLPEEINLLTKEGFANRSRLISNEEWAAYRSHYTAGLQALNPQASAEEVSVGVQELMEKELRVHYAASFANTGIAYSEQSKTIFARMMAFFERLRNWYNNLGFQTKEDLLRALFKGEMVHRADRAQTQAQSLARFNSILDSGGTVEASDQWESNGHIVKVFYEKDASQSKKESSSVVYQWHNSTGKVGELYLERQGPKGFNIEWVEVEKGKGNTLINLLKGTSLERLIIEEAERDLGVKFKLPGYFTQAGFQMARLGVKVGRVEKDLLDLFTKVTDGDATYYASPNFLQRQLGVWRDEVVGTRGQPLAHAHAVERFTFFRDLIRKLPKGIWSDPRLEKMFSLKRNWERDEVQGSLLRSGQQADENQLKKSLGFPAGETVDSFSKNFNLKQQLSQGENARALGVPFELSAPATMYSINLRNIWDFATGTAVNPLDRKHLMNLKGDMDRIGFFQKNWITLQQLGDINEGRIRNGKFEAGNETLNAFNSLAELMQNQETKWETPVSEVVREWDSGRSPERKEVISKVLFDLTEMKYLAKGEAQRLPDGWAQFLAGGPPTGNLLALFLSHKLLAKDFDIIRKTQNQFMAFLGDVELGLSEITRKTFANSPGQMQAALTKLAADFAAYKTKPYFPMVRFGQYTIAERSAQNGPVIGAYAFGSQRERDAAFREMRKQKPNSWITVSTVPSHSIEFMGLPQPLLEHIKDMLLDVNKPGLTTEQISLMKEQRQQIEEYEMLHMPDKSFRKRWLPAKGVPGHSLDAMRVYSHYFQSGSRYLARLMYMKPMRQLVQEQYLTASNGSRGDSTKARMIADYMNNWLNYYLEPGKDGGKLRAAAAIWYLGLSPAAAAMNLTQPFFVTWPKLTADFGAKAGAAFITASTYVSRLKGFNPHNYEVGTAEYQKARNEMLAQNYIEIGQAASLASYSEANNLSKLKAGSKIQSFWRKAGYAMVAFQAAEHYNREVTMRASWDLAMKNPDVKRLREIAVNKLLEINDLQNRLGMSEKEAVAFLYAKENIRRTQGLYNKASDSPFMRGPISKNTFVFFKYTQNMLWGFGHNGALIHMLLLYAFFYGLSGLPGSDDANELLRRLGQLIFGKDYDLHGLAREYARGLTRGTIFDETGPDLVMHGVSRYGFGPGLMKDFWYPKFDASANGSMGKIIPGFAEVMHGFNTGKATNDLLSEGAARAAGAGYGTVFALLHAMNDPGSADSKKWVNLILPRALKGVYTANRYGLSQVAGISTEPLLAQPLAATDSRGAKLPGTRFDPTDPQDIATILAQAAGFSATKANQAYEARREITDAESLYKYRKSTIMLQMYKAIEEGSPQAKEDVFKAITRYNMDVREIGDPQYSIDGRKLMQSMTHRSKQKAMIEMTLAKDRGQVGLARRVMDLYPGVQAERVK